MRLFCRLCGARTDGQERLGAYCPGNRCGTDLRAGNDTGTQAWCEPERQRGEPGRTVTARLVVRNSGSRPDTYRVEPVEQVDGRLDFDAGVLNVPLAPDQTRIVEIRHTLPQDRTALGIDVASRFGVPGADAAGRVNDGRADRFGVALRVVSTTANQGAACAAFAVDVPARFRPDRQNGNSSAARTRSVPLVVGGVVLALIVVVAAVVAVASNKDDDSTKSAAATSSETAPQVVVTAPIATATDGIGQGGNGGSKSGTGGNAANGGNGNGNQGGNGGNGGEEVTTPPGRKMVKVPSVTTLPDRTAESQLKAAGFNVRFEYLDGTGGPRGLVETQKPAANGTAPEGSTIVLGLRDGKVKVPNVIGMYTNEAAKTLEALNLVASRPQTFAVDRSRVIAVDPGVGELVAEGSTVVLTTE